MSELWSNSVLIWFDTSLSTNSCSRAPPEFRGRDPQPSDKSKYEFDFNSESYTGPILDKYALPVWTTSLQIYWQRRCFAIIIKIIIKSAHLNLFIVFSVWAEISELYLLHFYSLNWDLHDFVLLKIEPLRNGLLHSVLPVNYN